MPNVKGGLYSVIENLTQFAILLSGSYETQSNFLTKRLDVSQIIM